MWLAVAIRLQLARLFCYFCGRRIVERWDNLLYTGSGRCRQLATVDLLTFTFKRDVTFGDIERCKASEPPEGYSRNWKKRKAKFVAPSGPLKFVAF